MRSEVIIQEKLADLMMNNVAHFQAGIPYPEFAAGYKAALEWVLGKR